MLLPFVRELIDGPTPLHLIEKPTPGTGGTLLATVAALYTFFQRRPERAKLWSNIATAFAIVVIVGFGSGWFLGLTANNTP